MDQWIHCNKCFKFPAEGMRLWFTSCGHIICGTCIGKLEQIGDNGQQQLIKCTVCSKDASYLAINRHLRADIMDLFKQPKMLFQEYFEKLNNAFSFQAYHRERLTAHRQEKNNNVVEKLRIAEEELQKRAKKERALLEENSRLQMKLQNKMAHLGYSLLNTSNHSTTLINSPSSNSANSFEQRYTPRVDSNPAFLAGRNGIRSKPLKPVICASYSAIYPGQNTTTSNHHNSFFSSAASLYHHGRTASQLPNSSSLTTGRITKGPILPPSLGIHKH